MPRMLEVLPPALSGRTGWPWTEESPPPDGRRSWPRITVVTPSFNQGRYLEHAIRSVLLQNYPNLEYMVIDGGSSDESAEVIRKYRPWLTFAVSEADAGQADALNKGFQRATGQVHAYLNSDDFYEAGAFTTVAALLADPPVPRLIVGACDLVDEAGQRLRTHHSSIRTFADLADLWEVWYRDRYLPQPALFWSGPSPFTTRFRADLHYVMDYELWGRLLQSGLQVIEVSQTLAAFRTYPSQKSASPHAISREVIPLLEEWLQTADLPGIRRHLIASDLAYARLRDRHAATADGRSAESRRASLAAALVASPGVWFSRQMLRDVGHALKRVGRRLAALDATFGRIVARNEWGGSQSVSGPGSDLAQTEVIRATLPRLLEELGCKVLLDAPCGDFHWLSKARMPVNYVGCDIVGELVARNQARFGSERVRFFRADLTRDPLPPSDLILCRDCLVHLPDELVRRALENFIRSGSRYLLTTTFPDRPANEPIVPGEWRPLNLQRPPFNLPPPSRLINESCTEGNGAYRDKSLGLWELSLLQQALDAGR